MALWKFIKKNS